jgi:N-glycosylase/DNA lyase
MLVDAHGTVPSSSSSSKSGGGLLVVEPAEVWLRTLRELSTAEAREELLKFMGVGRKVADCVLLMSMDKVSIVFFSLPTWTLLSQQQQKWHFVEGSDPCRHACSANCD